MRRGAGIAAIAHEMLRIVHILLKTGKPYHDGTADYETLMVKRDAPRRRQYGYIAPAHQHPVVA